MLIDDIDFADLYLQQLRLAHRTEKTPDHWDQRAEKMAENCASPTDSYLQQLTSKIDLQGAQTLFDMGCGPYRWRWRTNSRRFMALITVRGC